jgi:hypothetical protein
MRNYSPPVFIHELPHAEQIKVGSEAFVVTNDESSPFRDITQDVAAAAGHPVWKTRSASYPSALCGSTL